MSTICVKTGGWGNLVRLLNLPVCFVSSSLRISVSLARCIFLSRRISLFVASHVLQGRYLDNPRLQSGVAAARYTTNPPQRGGTARFCYVHVPSSMSYAPLGRHHIGEGVTSG